MSVEHFRPGDIVGVEEFRSVHRDFGKGIYVPAGSDIALSIRFRLGPNPGYGYSDRWIEEGRILDYTGQGSPPGDQSWNRFNLGLLRAYEAGTRVHVFQELGGTPRTYRYWGPWLVTGSRLQYVLEQNRNVLRFTLGRSEDIGEDNHPA